MPSLPKTVFVLGLVSFFTDFSSEMIYPLLPLFLTQVLLAGPAALGVIEGVAESTASVLKVVSGIWADRIPRRKPLVVLGYSLSGFIRPLIGLAQTWPFVLFLRFVDRIGKGVRTSPRDALIADVSDLSNRGAAYGFHRSMDHAGAVVGPLVAFALLHFAGLPLRQIFLLTAIPALAAWMILVLGVKEGKPVHQVRKEKLNLAGDWKRLDGGFKGLLAALLVFTLGNSTDAFLLLRLSQVGLSAGIITLLWSLHHVVKMGATYYGGRLSDSNGRKPLIVSGWLFYALVYLAFAWVSQPAALVAVFLAYGIYFGLCEPSEKALVADLAPKNLKGTAFGYYHLTVGLGALPASLLFGAVAQGAGYPAAFALGAALAGLACVMLLLVPSPRNN